MKLNSQEYDSDTASHYCLLELSRSRATLSAVSMQHPVMLNKLRYLLRASCGAQFRTSGDDLILSHVFYVSKRGRLCHFSKPSWSIMYQSVVS